MPLYTLPPFHRWATRCSLSSLHFQALFQGLSCCLERRGRQENKQHGKKRERRDCCTICISYILPARAQRLSNAHSRHIECRNNMQVFFARQTLALASIPVTCQMSPLTALVSDTTLHLHCAPHIATLLPQPHLAVLLPALSLASRDGCAIHIITPAYLPPGSPPSMGDPGCRD